MLLRGCPPPLPSKPPIPPPRPSTPPPPNSKADDPPSSPNPSLFILTRLPPQPPSAAAAAADTSPASPPTLKIPYRSISLHARSSPPPCLYLQLLSTTGPIYDDHDPSNTISLTIIPSPTSTSTSTTSEEHEDEAQTLYTSLSACADLHPDPTNDDEDDDDDDAFWNNNDDDDPLGLDRIDERGVGYIAHGPAASDVDGNSGAGLTALPPPMPGSGGWITAENVGEFFDENGEVRAGGRLGDGAGRVRGRAEDDGGAEGHVVGNGDGAEGEGGDDEETKWRRTG